MEEYKKREDGSEQWIYSFPNGYGCSVIKGPASYGGSKGLYELAVLKDGELCYDTYITSDVIGHLSWKEVCFLVDKVRVL